ncbi:MAG TPA: SdrD B-like domain-containing protein, partial [Pyrinomonadaceae bacterium]
GQMLTAGLRASSARYALRADFGVGTFAGWQAEGVETDGAGAAADVSGSFNLRDDLSVQGHYTFNSRNFMAAQAGAASAANLRSVGLTWSPRRWLTASVTDTASSRPHQRDSQERFTTATFNLTPPRYLTSLFVSHTEYRTALAGGGSYTLVNASKNFDRWSLFANASRIKNSGDTYQHAQLGARLRLREADSLQISQTFGGNGTLAGTLDWLTPSLLSKRVSLGAGLGYSRSANSPFRPYQRLNASVNLPFRQTLHVSYGHLQTGSQLHLSLRGPLFFTRRAGAEADPSAAALKRYGSVSGRVYQDLNFNGRYDAGVDQPQANVRVRVDGNLSVTTDGSGTYRIDNAEAGEHTVALDLLSVRADLTILGDESRAVSLSGGFNTVVDFRTARTGRVTGAVWLDANGDGVQDADEKPLADVRVVTSTGRDTLTDESGQFVVADLAPGLHVLVVDVKTLPDETIVRAFAAAGQPLPGARRAGAKDGAQTPAAASLQVTVVAGAETGDIRFAVSPKPPERKQF